ncbi:MAG: hypothetical protein RMJ19_06305 [Gemmatales bacterium]|nr:hypothetical protein [Gemmatales bacterium]MDW8175266.1 hypothetical protein [Gemmatales bacterium]
MEAPDSAGGIRSVIIAYGWAMTLVLAGCVTTMPTPWPTLLAPEMTVENPLFVPQAHLPQAYELVFRKTTNAIATYFPIAYSNRYDGRIETAYVVSAGWLEPWQFGPYDKYEATESTLQSIRRRCLATIFPAEAGGYYVEVKVYKELEDLARPVYASAGAVLTRLEETPGRAFVLPAQLPPTERWIPMGRDQALEQLILLRLKQCL